MNIYARITTKSKELSIEEAKLLVRYANESTNKEEKHKIEDDVFKLLKRIFPNIEEGTDDSYIPGPWIDYFAFDNGIDTEECYCEDIVLDELINMHEV